MTNEQAKWELEHIYGMVAPDVQRALDVALKAIEEQPTGEWIYDGTYHDNNNPIDADTYHCSVCKRGIITSITKPAEVFPYCHCGAKMKVGEEA